MRGRERLAGRARFIVPIPAALLVLLLSGWLWWSTPLFQSSGTGLLQMQTQQYQQSIKQVATSPTRLLNGQLASLGWIVGKDCQRGMQAYLATVKTNPDAALVGTGWVDPTSGQLIDGQSNNCMPGSLSMDNVVRLVHSKGGMAYLTVTMETDGSSGSWNSQQQSSYIAQAAGNPGLIAPIIHEVQRLNYDGVIMDLEAGNSNYPNIQQLFAQFNQRVGAALKPLHKLYGIALIHKLNDHDDYYGINGFENWTLLGHAADFIVIMAVDQSFYAPGPTVSVPWLKQLLSYALQTMPQMLTRLVWELPLYGATWTLQGANWVFDTGVNYLDGVNLVARIPSSEIDVGASNLNDPTCAHLVYTDSSGVTHALWYHTAKNLYSIISQFRQVLEQTPQFHHSHLIIAVWYRATWEPGSVWTMLRPILPN